MERRLAAILAADVASYSLLMNADEDGTYRVWKSVRSEIVDPLIDQHSGRIVKHTGDGFLAEFPTVHAAVECGAQIQTDMADRDDAFVAGQPFQFRIGINLGDIIVDNEDIHGDGVNIAARLESIATAGGVCVSGDVYRQVRNKPGLLFRDLGERRVKNIRIPVQAYSVRHGDAEAEGVDLPEEVREATSSSSSLGILFDPAKARTLRSSDIVVGRDEERKQIDEAFSEALSEQGNIVLVRGEPGIGKSTLVRGFVDALEEESAIVLYGQCHETLGSPPYWPWMQILKALDLSEEYTGNSCGEMLQSLGGDGAEDGEQRSSFSHESGSDQFALFNALSEVFADAAKSRPVVIFIDDLHWADRSSLLLLTHFGTRIYGLPVLIIGTYRDMEITRKHPLSEAMAVLNREATLRRIALKGLESDAVGEVIGRAVGESVPSRVLEALCDKTGGNPLFVAEVARMLQTQNVDFSSANNLEFEIPEGIQEAAGQRFNQLSEECIKILSIASVVGRRFSVRLVARLQSAIDELDMLELLEEAVERGVIQESREQGADFQFKHVLFRDIIYDELSLAKKTILHGKVADVLAETFSENDVASLGEIARHYYSALRGGNTDRVLEYAGKAAAQAAKLTAYSEAIEYQQLMLEVYELDEQTHAHQIAESSATIFKYLNKSGGRIAEARPYLELAMKTARANGQYEIMADVACLLAYWGRWQHETVGVTDLLNEVLGLLDDDAHALRANVLAHKSLSLVFAQRRAEAETTSQEAIELAELSGDKQIHASSLCLATAVFRGLPDRLDDRVAMAKKALELSEQAQDRSLMTDSLEWLILSDQEAGNITRVRESIRYLETLAARGKEHKSRYATLNSQIWLALFEGKWESAETQAEQALEAGADKLDSSAEGVYGAQMFLINRELGRLPMIAQTIKGMVSDTTNVWKPGLLATFVEARMLEEAEQLLAQLADENFADLRGDEMHLTCLVYFVLACVDLNRKQHAQYLLDQLTPYAGQFVAHPTAVSYGPCDMYLGMLFGLLDDIDTALANFESAAAQCAEVEPTMWASHVAYQHARVLVKAGADSDSAEVAGLLDAATNHATKLGMANVLERITRLREGEVESEESPLTPKELKVLELIVQGMSNKAIAAELNRSLPTVATHVRAILSKTETANRTEAAAYARERELF